MPPEAQHAQHEAQLRDAQQIAQSSPLPDLTPTSAGSDRTPQPGSQARQQAAEAASRSLPPHRHATNAASSDRPLPDADDNSPGASPAQEEPQHTGRTDMPPASLVDLVSIAAAQFHASGAEKAQGHDPSEVPGGDGSDTQNTAAAAAAEVQPSQSSDATAAAAQMQQPNDGGSQPASAVSQTHSSPPQASRDAEPVEASHPLDAQQPEAGSAGQPSSTDGAATSLGTTSSTDLAQAAITAASDSSAAPDAAVDLAAPSSASQSESNVDPVEGSSKEEHGTSIAGVGSSEQQPQPGQQAGIADAPTHGQTPYRTAVAEDSAAEPDTSTEAMQSKPADTAETTEQPNVNRQARERSADPGAAGESEPADTAATTEQPHVNRQAREGSADPGAAGESDPASPVLHPEQESAEHGGAELTDAEQERAAASHTELHAMLTEEQGSGHTPAGLELDDSDSTGEEGRQAQEAPQAMHAAVRQAYQQAGLVPMDQGKHALRFAMTQTEGDPNFLHINTPIAVVKSSAYECVHSCSKFFLSLSHALRCQPAVCGTCWQCRPWPNCNPNVTSVHNLCRAWLLKS